MVNVFWRYLKMKGQLYERCKEIAIYVMENGATVRQAAVKFDVSKSTVYKDMTERLPQINPMLAMEVRQVLQKNKQERHIRGGIATKKKYALLKDII